MCVCVCVCVGGWRVSAPESDGVCSLIVFSVMNAFASRIEPEKKKRKKKERKKESFATRQTVSSY